jgi:peroxiredoxin
METGALEMSFPMAPELIVSSCLNTEETITLKAFRGSVVLIEAFQMLCPGCVEHGLPQASRVARIFDSSDVQVIGLHSVFEHHDTQGSRAALEAFVHEYKISFPIAIDKQSPDSRIPQTMSQYQLQGTPSLLLIDHEGRLRARHFGLVQDLALGAELMALVTEQY